MSLATRPTRRSSLVISTRRTDEITGRGRPEQQVRAIRDRNEHDDEDGNRRVEQIHAFHVVAALGANRWSAAQKPTALSQIRYGMIIPRSRSSVPTLPFVSASAAAVGSV